MGQQQSFNAPIRNRRPRTREEIAEIARRRGAIGYVPARGPMQNILSFLPDTTAAREASILIESDARNNPHFALEGERKFNVPAVAEQWIMNRMNNRPPTNRRVISYLSEKGFLDLGIRFNDNNRYIPEALGDEEFVKDVLRFYEIYFNQLITDNHELIADDPFNMNQTFGHMSHWKIRVFLQSLPNSMFNLETMDGSLSNFLHNYKPFLVAKATGELTLGLNNHLAGMSEPLKSDRTFILLLFNIILRKSFLINVYPFISEELQLDPFFREGVQRNNY